MKVLRERTRWVALFVLGLLAGVVVVVVVNGAVSAIRTRDTQTDRAPQNEQNDETLAIIKDCTQPSGSCYRRNQKRTAKAVGDIGRYIVLASACAADVSPSAPVDDRIADITACVTDRLAVTP